MPPWGMGPGPIPRPRGGGSGTWHRGGRRGGGRGGSGGISTRPSQQHPGTLEIGRRRSGSLHSKYCCFIYCMYT